MILIKLQQLRWLLVIYLWRFSPGQDDSHPFLFLGYLNSWEKCRIFAWAVENSYLHPLLTLSVIAFQLQASPGGGPSFTNSRGHILQVILWHSLAHLV
jgi:hypothetical protein